MINYIVFMLLFQLGDATINLLNCGKSYNCFRKPPGCISLSACDAVATFRVDNTTNTVTFQLAAKYKWIGFGQKKKDGSNAMVNIRGQYCLRGPKPYFGNFNGNSLKSPGTPTWVDKVDGVQLVSKETTSDGSILCTYKRPVQPSSASDQYLYNLNRSLLAIIAYGNGESNGQPTYHGFQHYAVTATALNFLKSQLITLSSSSINKVIKAHACLMILAWVLFATLGIFTSRYMKHLQYKVFEKAAWFRLHQLLMSSCVLCFVIGFILILQEKKGWNVSTAGVHPWIGLFAVILGLVQPFMALVRCEPDDERRIIFNWSHRVVGMSAWVLAALTVVFGLSLIKEKIQPMIVLLCVIALLFIMFEVCLEAKKMRRKTNSSDYTYSSVDGRLARTVNPLATNMVEGKCTNPMYMLAVFVLAMTATVYHMYIIIKM